MLPNKALTRGGVLGLSESHGLIIITVTAWRSFSLKRL